MLRSSARRYLTSQARAKLELVVNCVHMMRTESSFKMYDVESDTYTSFFLYMDLDITTAMNCVYIVSALSSLDMKNIPSL